MASTKETLDIPAPRPWSIDGQTIRDREGVVVMSALNPASMATRRLIVEAVNERDRLRDIVRRLAEYIRLGHCNEVHIDYADRPSYHVRVADLLEEAREAIGEDAP